MSLCYFTQQCRENPSFCPRLPFNNFLQFHNLGPSWVALEQPFLKTHLRFALNNRRENPFETLGCRQNVQTLAELHQQNQVLANSRPCGKSELTQGASEVCSVLAARGATSPLLCDREPFTSVGFQNPNSKHPNSWETWDNSYMTETRFLGFLLTVNSLVWLMWLLSMIKILALKFIF